MIQSEYELRQHCALVERNDVNNVVDKLRYALRKQNKRAKSADIFGIGLAANQINIQKRVAIVCIPWLEIDLVLINPIITAFSGSTIQCVEGCLSFPNKTFETERYEWVEVYCPGWTERQVFFGLAGIAVQHEIAHLYGLLPQDFSQAIKPSEWENAARRICAERFSEGREVPALA